MQINVYKNSVCMLVCLSAIQSVFLPFFNGHVLQMFTHALIPSENESPKQSKDVKNWIGPTAAMLNAKTKLIGRIP